MYGVYKSLPDCCMQFVPSERGWLQARRVGANHTRIDAKADDYSVCGKCRGMSRHSQSQRVAAHLFRDRDRRWKYCCPECVGARERSGRGNLPPTDAFRDFGDLCAVDAAWHIAENDIDGSADLDRIEAILRKIFRQL